MDSNLGCTLDEVSSIRGVGRNCYGYDPENKPNDHCSWQESGFTMDLSGWYDTDEHMRKRIKEIINA